MDDSSSTKNTEASILTKKSEEANTRLEEKVKEIKLNNKKKDTQPNDAPNEEDDADFENGRLFIRNLCYACKEEELEKLFEPYAPIVETNMPIDNFSKKPKGFAYLTFMFPEKALKAFNELDGTIFQGKFIILKYQGKFITIFQGVWKAKN